MDNTTMSFVELVMTVPEPYGTRFSYDTGCRSTLGVLVQLLTRAKRRVIISAPYIQRSHELADGVISTAIKSALRNRIRVDVLSTGLSLEAIDRNKLLGDTFGKLQYFQPSANIIDEQKLGSHAKFCVADGESAYVGSANLTGPGLFSQFELGLLVHGKIARQIEEFWDYAVEAGLFVSVR